MRHPRSFTVVLAALLLGTAGIAEADYDPPMSLRIDTETLTGTVDGATLTKSDIGTGLELGVLPRVKLFADIRFGMFRIGFDSVLDEGLRGRGTIWSYLEVSGKTGLSVRLLDHERWKLDVFSEYETSLFGLDPEMTEFRILTDEGRFDVTPYAERNVAPHVFWNRATAGLGFGAVFGDLTISTAIAYQVVGAELDLALNDESRTTIRQLGFDDSRIERRHSLSFWSIAIMPGFDYELAHGMTIGADAMVMPAGDSWLFGGGARFRKSL